MSEVPQELSSILAEIEKALDAGLHYAALVIALSIPDICSSLAAAPTTDPDALRHNRKRQRKRYKEWFDEHLARQLFDLSADDCYSMRCGVVHQGRVRRPD